MFVPQRKKFVLRSRCAVDVPGSSAIRRDLAAQFGSLVTFGYWGEGSDWLSALRRMGEDPLQSPDRIFLPCDGKKPSFGVNRDRIRMVSLARLDFGRADPLKNREQDILPALNQACRFVIGRVSARIIRKKFVERNEAGERFPRRSFLNHGFFDLIDTHRLFDPEGSGARAMEAS